MSDSDREGSTDGELQAEMEIKQLTQSIRALKGHMTRRIRSAEKAVTSVGRTPSSHAVRELLEFQKSIQDQFDKLESTYAKLLELDEERYNVYNGELNREADRKDETADKIRAALNAASNRPGASVRDRPTSVGKDPKVKPNKALEPHKLTRDHTTVEMRSWSKKFKAWYSSSNMQQASIPEQQAYFRMVIDVHLENKLAAQMQEGHSRFWL